MRKYRVGDIVRPSKNWYEWYCQFYVDLTEDYEPFFVTNDWIKERQAEDIGRITKSCGWGYVVTWGEARKRNYDLYEAWWKENELELVAKHHSYYTRPDKNKYDNRDSANINFRDFDVRGWGDGELSMFAEDMQCFVSATHIGIQTNSYDKKTNAEIERICGRIRDDFKKLNELLNKIE